MASLTVGVGTLLILMGVGGYVATGMVSVTALIPAFFGAPIAVLGQIAKNEARRKHAMHGAVLLGLLGFLGSFPGLLKLPSLLAGTAERPTAVAMQALMAVLLGVFVILCVRSFIAARRASQG